MKTSVVGLLILELDKDRDLLLVENNGLYSFPEKAVEGSTQDSIVEVAEEMMTELGLKTVAKSLAYVVKQPVPDSDEVIINYYFIILADTPANIPTNCKWFLDSYNMLDEKIYPQAFRNNLKEHIQGRGLIFNDIQVIEG